MTTMEKNAVVHPLMRWEHIRGELEMLIVRGALKGGDKIFSISEIAETFHVSKTTAKKVLEVMCEDGIISKRMGIGHFVKPYVKEKLREKYKNVVDTMLDDVLDRAELLKLEQNEIEEMVERAKERVAMQSTHGEE